MVAIEKKNSPEILMMRQWTLPESWIWTLSGDSQLLVHPSCTGNFPLRIGDRRPK